MKLVSSWGEVYRMSDKHYRKMLKQLAKDGEVNLNDYGKPIGYIDADITDMTQEEAEDKLTS